MPAPHSDEDYGFIADTMDRPRTEVAESLGWSVDSVSDARSRIRSGWSPKIAAWTEDEDDLIRAMSQSTNRQILPHLPGRTYEALKVRRTRIDPSTDRNPYHASPYGVGARPLVAKTCSTCGKLLAGVWFAWRNGSKTWASSCRMCNAGGTRGWRERTSYSSQHGNDRRQAITLPNAQSNGSDWTTAEMLILADTNLTTLEKAVRLKRTYYATATALARYGFAAAPNALGDQEKDVWVIDNPYADLIA